MLASIRNLLAVFGDQGWLNDLPLDYHEIAPTLGASVAEDADFAITAAPACHSVPSLALRFARRDTGRAFVYSGDTLPCDHVEALACNAALLFHEATDSDKGHTRPAAAGALAARAGAERLVLIHYYTQLEAMTYARVEAEKAFGAPVALAEAFRSYPWS